jgi:hypothetical protein
MPSSLIKIRLDRISLRKRSANTPTLDRSSLTARGDDADRRRDDPAEGGYLRFYDRNRRPTQFGKLSNQDWAWATGLGLTPSLVLTLQVKDRRSGAGLLLSALIASLWKFDPRVQIRNPRSGQRQRGKFPNLAETAVGAVDGGGVGSPPTLAGAISPVP